MDDREEALRREIDQSVIRTGLHSITRQAEAAKYASEIRDLSQALINLTRFPDEWHEIHARLRILLGIEE